MGVFENLPYTNFHELNLDWIVKKIKELEIKTASLNAFVDEVSISGLIAIGAHTVLDTESVNTYIQRCGNVVMGRITATVSVDGPGEFNICRGLPAPAGAKAFRAWTTKDPDGSTYEVKAEIIDSADVNPSWDHSGVVTVYAAAVSTGTKFVTDFIYLAEPEEGEE